MPDASLRPLREAPEGPAITPALTPEEWGVAGRYAPEAPHIDRRVAWGAMLAKDGLSIGSTFDQQAAKHRPLPSDERHALAALCLYQQSFGFTREDTKMLDDAAGMIREEFGTTQLDVVSALQSILKRITALLPPDSRGESSRTTTP